MPRMTKTSKDNLLVSDRIEIDYSSVLDVYFVRIFKGDNLAYLSDTQGAISYKTTTAALRVVKRVRPDLVPAITQG